MLGMWTYPTRPLVRSCTTRRFVSTHSRYRASMSFVSVFTVTVRGLLPFASPTVIKTSVPAWFTSNARWDASPRRRSADHQFPATCPHPGH